MRESGKIDAHSRSALPYALADVMPVAAALDSLHDLRGLMVLRDLLWDGPTREDVILSRHGAAAAPAIEDYVANGLVNRDGERSDVLCLTAAGACVGPLVQTLQDFGTSFVRSVPPSEAMLSYLVARASEGPSAAPLARTLDGVACLEIAGRRVGLEIRPTRVGPAPPDPHDGRVNCAHDIFVDLLEGALRWDDVVESRLVSVSGDVRLVEGAIRLLRGESVRAGPGRSSRSIPPRVSRL